MQYHYLKNRIKKVLFKWDYLKDIIRDLEISEPKNSEGVQPLYMQMNYYSNMVSHIKDEDLCFRKVVCSK